MTSKRGSSENKTALQALAEKQFRAKEKRRRELAALPFEKKIEILIQLQKIAYSIRKPSKKEWWKRPWDLNV